ncbi:MAG: deoxyribodipyrimidine photolyase [Pseudonocardiales bacterium]|nr:deoxyribodipyrimidine photolyase [Pseudonocardiales bacterium]
MPAVMWFRRDLRLHDHPALNAAASDGPVVALFVLDDVLRRPAGGPRLAYLYRSLRALDSDLRERGGRLIVRRGTPETVVPAVAREAGASSVHVSADFGPYGSTRDERVEKALGDIALTRTGSPYAVAPGRVTKDDGDPYSVYTPFYRAWQAHGWREPARLASGITWVTELDDSGIPKDPELDADAQLPEAGEAAARATWSSYREEHLPDYAKERDRPDLDATSRMSVYLKYGNIHPRTLLADLGDADETYRKELAWREFYAAVLHFHPSSAREYYRPELAKMTYSTGARAEADFAAWQAGKTGYPIVDAGMRQLLAQGWMHNRLRMIVASFLVKDLHLEWTAGARHFMNHLVDGDLASNQHGWQWTAGTGTDAAPYFRIFNPTTQGLKFDPNGDYVRRWVPELRPLSGSQVHEPARHGGAEGYPEPIVDHAKEREVALSRYQATRRT